MFVKNINELNEDDLHFRSDKSDPTGKTIEYEELLSVVIDEDYKEYLSDIILCKCWKIF